MQKITRILVPVDGSPSSDKALDTAILLAMASGAALDLLYVSYFDSGTDDVVEKISRLPDSVAGSSSKAAEAILRHAREHIPAGIEVGLHRETGTPARKIVDFAAKNGNEMTVVGGRGLGIVAGFLLGSVSQEVMELAGNTVVVVR